MHKYAENVSDPRKLVNRDVDRSFLSIDMNDRFSFNDNKSSNKSAFNIYSNSKKFSDNVLCNSTNILIQPKNALIDDSVQKIKPFRTDFKNIHSLASSGQKPTSNQASLLTIQPNSFQVIDQFKERVLQPSTKVPTGSNMTDSFKSALGEIYSKSKNEARKSVHFERENKAKLSDFNQELSKVT
jgi:hypothetical protein